MIFILWRVWGREWSEGERETKKKTDVWCCRCIQCTFNRWIEYFPMKIWFNFILLYFVSRSFFFGIICYFTCALLLTRIFFIDDLASPIMHLIKFVINNAITIEFSWLYFIPFMYDNRKCIQNSKIFVWIGLNVMYPFMLIQKWSRFCSFERVENIVY